MTSVALHLVWPKAALAMLHIARSLKRLSRIIPPRIPRPHIYVQSRCQATYPLYPPGVTIEADPKDEDYDTITIDDEVFRRKYAYFSWLCIPAPKMDPVLYAQQHEMLLEWRELTQYTKPPVYPEIEFYHEWFDLMIRCDMAEEIKHFYALGRELQLGIAFEEDLNEKIENYLEGAIARSYHNWERM